MSEFKGTIGQWYIDNEEIYENEFGMPTTPICVNTKGRIIVGLCDVYGDNEEAKSNALLISKAPKMLKALEELKEQISRCYFNEVFWEEKLDNLIKEATELK